jgi:hypothetical protein
MLPTARVQSTGREKLNLVERVQRAIDRIPFPQRIVPILGAVLFLCPVLAPAAVVTKSRTKMATAYVAMLAIWLIYVFGLYSSDPASLPSAPVRWSLLVLPVVIAVISHLRPLSSWYVPCRTAAVTLVWPVVFVVVLLKQLPHLHISVVVGVVAAWLLAVIALGWRSAKGMQDARIYEPPAGHPGARPGGRPGPMQRPGGQGAAGGVGYPGAMGGHIPGYGPRAQGVAQAYADRAAREQQAAAGARARPPARAGKRGRLDSRIAGRRTGRAAPRHRQPARRTNPYEPRRKRPRQ